MSECQNVPMRESLPELLHGALDAESAERVREHVDGCVGCTAELALMRSVLRTAPAPSIDVARIAAAIPSYADVKRTEHADIETPRLTVIAGGDTRRSSAPSVRKRVFSVGTLRLAAGFLVAAIGATTVVANHTGPFASQSHLAAAPAGTSIVGVSELSDDHLAQLIGEVDHIDAMPTEEPEPATPAAIPSTSDEGL